MFKFFKTPEKSTILPVEKQWEGINLLLTIEGLGEHTIKFSDSIRLQAAMEYIAEAYKKGYFYINYTYYPYHKLDKFYIINRYA